MERRYWLLGANPRIFRIDDAVRELKTDYWRTKRSRLRLGDGVVIWRHTGEDGRRGVVALGEVLEEPVVRGPAPEEYPYILKEDPASAEPRTLIWYAIPPNVPLWLGDPGAEVLMTLSVVRQPQGTVKRVEEWQWHELLHVLGGWPGETRAPM